MPRVYCTNSECTGYVDGECIKDYISIGDNECDIFEKTYEAVNNTNYDRIKAMSVEELADVLYDANDKICFENCSASTGNKFSCHFGENVDISECKKCMKKWLESEVSE